MNKEDWKVMSLIVLIYTVVFVLVIMPDFAHAQCCKKRKPEHPETISAEIVNEIFNTESDAENTEDGSSAIEAETKTKPDLNKQTEDDGSGPVPSNQETEGDG